MDNQTDDLWLVGADTSDPGTGIFVCAAEDYQAFGQHDYSLPWQSPSTQIQYVKNFVRDLTYTYCLARGLRPMVIGFKWVPESIATFADLTIAPVHKPIACVRRCAVPGSICVKGECSI